MRENPLRSAFDRGAAVLNGWLHIPSSVSAEAMAHAGFDSLTVDLQHGPIGFESALGMLQAISTTATVPMARVPWNDPAAIMRVLDAGAYGVICPLVDDREACERFVAACRYPPAGIRSWGPTRARLYARGYAAAQADRLVVTIAMIETAEALENLKEIVSTPGLDAVYVGPADLGLSLGREPGEFFADESAEGVLGAVVHACRDSGVAPGIHTSDLDQARRALSLGYRFVTVASDLGYLSGRAAEVVDALDDLG